MPTNEQRAHRAGKAIAHYGDDSNELNLIDFLADAMHWCHHNGEDFHYVFAQACRHFVDEFNDDQHDERRLS